jgi:O-antigen/teichoic acid export membrane protein
MSIVTIIRQKLRRYPALNSEFLHNILRLVAGNFAAQLLTLLAYPFLTRLYAPADMGVLAFVSTAAVILSPLVALRYEMALPLAGTDEEAGSVLAVCFVTLCATTALIALALWLAPLSAFARFGTIAPYRMFLPLSMFAFGAYTIVTYEATRLSRFSDIARTRIFQALNGPLVQIVLGALHVGKIGLLIGFIVGQGAGTLGLSRKLVFGAHSPLRQVTLKSAKAAAFKYRHFALFSSWSGVFSFGASALTTLLLTLLYGPVVGGYLFLGERVLVRPMGLLTMSFLQVFMMEAGKAARERPEELRRLFLSITKKQFVISTLWIGSIVLGAPYVIPLAFGNQWDSASIYIQVIGLAFFPSSIANSVMFTLQLIGKQKLAAGLDVVRFCLVLLSLVTAYWLGATPLQALFASSAVLAVTQGIILVIMYLAVDRISRAPRFRLANSETPVQ